MLMNFQSPLDTAAYRISRGIELGSSLPKDALSRTTCTGCADSRAFRSVPRHEPVDRDYLGPKDVRGSGNREALLVDDVDSGFGKLLMSIFPYAHAQGQSEMVYGMLRVIIRKKTNTGDYDLLRLTLFKRLLAVLPMILKLQLQTISMATGSIHNSKYRVICPDSSSVA
jgi:hypothetical protein